MSRPRYLADHDLNEHIIDGVLRREPAIEFIRAREVGLAERADSGLLMVHQLQPVASVIDSLVLIWSASEAEEWRDQIAFLPL